MMPYMAAKAGLRVAMQTKNAPSGTTVHLVVALCVCGLLCVSCSGSPRYTIAASSHPSANGHGDCGSALTNDAQSAKSDSPGRGKGAGTSGRTGKASYYAAKFHGRRTASGERYDSLGFTAAHRTLPFGTMVTVTGLGNGKSVAVRINDRGPAIKSRIIDLSAAAAKQIGMTREGIIDVSVTVIENESP